MISSVVEDVGVLVRAYREGDFVDVCRVHDAARPLELAGCVDLRAYRPMGEIAREEGFFFCRTLVAEVEGEVVGFCSMEGSYISWLYVDPARRREGIGRTLLERAVAEIGTGGAWTHVLAGNRAAVEFYRAMGFMVVRDFASTCDGYRCRYVRMAVPGSRMADPRAVFEG